MTTMTEEQAQIALRDLEQFAKERGMFIVPEGGMLVVGWVKSDGVFVGETDALVIPNLGLMEVW